MKHFLTAENLPIDAQHFANLPVLANGDYNVPLPYTLLEKHQTSNPYFSRVKEISLVFERPKAWCRGDDTMFDKLKEDYVYNGDCWGVVVECEEFPHPMPAYFFRELVSPEFKPGDKVIYARKSKFGDWANLCLNGIYTVKEICDGLVNVGRSYSISATCFKHVDEINIHSTRTHEAFINDEMQLATVSLQDLSEKIIYGTIDYKVGQPKDSSKPRTAVDLLNQILAQ